MTPLSVSMVIGAMLSGPIIGIIKRYQFITILGTLLMVVGTFLLTLMTPTTSLPLAILFMILAGLGTGTLFSMTAVAQNALPANRLGVGTAATRYLGQLGATLGIAIVGTVVNSSVSSDLLRRLPTTRVGQLALAEAIQHGFVAVLIFALIALLVTLFLKDVPFVTTSTTIEPEIEADEETDKELTAPNERKMRQ